MKKYAFLILFAFSLPLAALAQIDSGSTIRYDTVRTVRQQARTFDSQALRRSAGKPQETRAVRQEQKVQKEQTRTRSNEGRWMFGGGVGFGIGDDEWNLQISPQVGYRVTNMLVLGGGISYGYFEGRGWYDYSSNILGVNGLLQFYPIRNMSIFAQPEVCYQWGRSDGRTVDIDPVFCLPLGVGFVIPVWNGGITVSFSYDVMQARYSPYGNRIACSVGYMFRW